MKKCSRCDLDSVIRQGNQWLCAKHYRFGQMKVLAKRMGKKVPEHCDLELIAPKDMKCGDCGVLMNWRAADGQSTVASLQHYRDGTLGIVCRSCNTRHAFMDGDSYREMPKDHKKCPGCNEIKPLTEFFKDNSRSGPMKVTSKCKICNGLDHKKWCQSNREKYNEYQRKWRAEAKARDQ